MRESPPVDLVEQRPLPGTHEDGLISEAGELIEHEQELALGAADFGNAMNKQYD
jgi:hypothetical protein